MTDLSEKIKVGETTDDSVQEKQELDPVRLKTLHELLCRNHKEEEPEVLLIKAKSMLSNEEAFKDELSILFTTDSIRKDFFDSLDEMSSLYDTTIEKVHATWIEHELKDYMRPLQKGLHYIINQFSPKMAQTYRKRIGVAVAPQIFEKGSQRIVSNVERLDRLEKEKIKKVTDLEERISQSRESILHKKIRMEASIEEIEAYKEKNEELQNDLINAYKRKDAKAQVKGEQVRMSYFRYIKAAEKARDLAAREIISEKKKIQYALGPLKRAKHIERSAYSLKIDLQGLLEETQSRLEHFDSGYDVKMLMDCLIEIRKQGSKLTDVSNLMDDLEEHLIGATSQQYNPAFDTTKLNGANEHSSYSSERLVDLAFRACDDIEEYFQSQI